MRSTLCVPPFAPSKASMRGGKRSEITRPTPKNSPLIGPNEGEKTRPNHPPLPQFVAPSFCSMRGKIRVQITISPHFCDLPLIYASKSPPTAGSGRPSRLSDPGMSGAVATPSNYHTASHVQFHAKSGSLLRFLPILDAGRGPILAPPAALYFR